MKHSRQEIWADRPDEGKSRPTPERRRMGKYRLVDGEDAGATVAYDEAADPVAAANMAGVIDAKTVDAFRTFEALARAINGSPSQRSCLNIEPIGYDEDDDDPDAWREWKSVTRELGMIRTSLAMTVAYEQEPIANDRLQEVGSALVAIFRL